MTRKSLTTVLAITTVGLIILSSVAYGILRNLAAPAVETPADYDGGPEPASGSGFQAAHP